MRLRPEPGPKIGAFRLISPLYALKESITPPQHAFILREKDHRQAWVQPHSGGTTITQCPAYPPPTSCTSYHFSAETNIYTCGEIEDLHKIGMENSEKYLHEGGPACLAQATVSLQEALELCPVGHPEREVRLTNLGFAISRRYDQEGNLDDLTRAMEYHQEALNLRPGGHPDRWCSLSNLASALSTRYDREGNLDDLIQAIQRLQEALSLQSSGHPSRPILLSNLGVTLSTRYDEEGNLDHLIQAIQCHQETFDLRPAGHPDRWYSLNNLAPALSTRYSREGNLGDLIQAIQHHQEALSLQPSGHPNRSMSLSNLGVAFSRRHDREGNLDDILQAIQCHQEALDLRPAGHPDRWYSLNNPARGLSTRYDREGNLDDLVQAIQHHQEALSLRSSNHPNQSMSLSNLGIALSKRYDQEGNLDSLTQAIQYYREALDLRPSGHPDRSTSLSNLGVALSKRYDQEGNLDCLMQAIQYHREALNLRSAGHPRRCYTLYNLAFDLVTRYDEEGDLDDLVQARQYYQEMLVLLPSGHPFHVSSLHHQALALFKWHKRVQSMHEAFGTIGVDASEASGQRLQHAEPTSHGVSSGFPDVSTTDIVALLREASLIVNCSPRDSLQATLDWIRISKDIDSTSTLDAYTSALHQLDVVLALRQSLDQRQASLLSDDILVETRSLGDEAATWALRHGKLEKAVELLEQGRTLLMAQVGRYRVELEDLHQANSTLSVLFEDLSRHLEACVLSNQSMEANVLMTSDPYEIYRKVSTKWIQTVDEIRALPDFDTFPKPMPYGRLRKAAAEGPIVVIVPNKRSSEALIIREHAPIYHVHLPLASSDRLTELSDIFGYVLDPVNSDGGRAEALCMANLRTLWDEIVGPVARALRGELGIPLRSRVWWCPTSMMAFLPLHAAGLYSRGQPLDSFPNLYVSSYTPTLWSLLRVRRQASAKGPAKLLVVSQPDTPDEVPLGHATEEAYVIRGTVSPIREVTILSAEEGSLEAVQLQMESHPWVHFICHGIQTSGHPLDSYLSLHDGRLTLRKIIEQNLPKADLAFLSACHSTLQ